MLLRCYTTTLQAKDTFSTYMNGFQYINNIVFTIDLSVALLGYALPFSRLHGAHFKSTDNRLHTITHPLNTTTPLLLTC